MHVAIGCNRGKPHDRDLGSAQRACHPIAGEPHPVRHLSTFNFPPTGILSRPILPSVVTTSPSLSKFCPRDWIFVRRFLNLNFPIGVGMYPGGDGGPTDLLPTLVEGGPLGIKVDSIEVSPGTPSPFHSNSGGGAGAGPLAWRRWCRFLPIPLTYAGGQGERDCAEEDGSDRVDEGIHGMLRGQGALRKIPTRHVIRWSKLPKKSDYWRTTQQWKEICRRVDDVLGTVYDQLFGAAEAPTDSNGDHTGSFPESHINARIANVKAIRRLQSKDPAGLQSCVRCRLSGHCFALPKNHRKCRGRKKWSQQSRVNASGLLEITPSLICCSLSVCSSSGMPG